MTTEDARPAEVCSDCERLKSGTSSLPGPHPYLVQLPQTETNPAAASYRCLLCQSTLTHELVDQLHVWR